MSGNGTGRENRVTRAAFAAALLFVAVAILAPGHPAEAGNLRVVRGIVGTVSGSHLFVDGKSVDLAGVSIQNPSGKQLSLAEIAPGTKVGLFYRRGNLVSVLVYPPMAE